ncbi:MAG: hypothetical protein ACHQRJ_04755 [Alphaproteobacteria bacterium]
MDRRVFFALAAAVPVASVTAAFGAETGPSGQRQPPGREQPRPQMGSPTPTGEASGAFSLDDAAALLGDDSVLRASATLSELQRKLGGGPSARSHGPGYVFIWSDYALIFPPSRDSQVVAIPPELRITPDMNLKQALAAIKASSMGARAKGLIVTEQGPMLVM